VPLLRRGSMRTETWFWLPPVSPSTCGTALQSRLGAKRRIRDSSYPGRIPLPWSFLRCPYGSGEPAPHESQQTKIRNLASPWVKFPGIFCRCCTPKGNSQRPLWNSAGDMHPSMESGESVGAPQFLTTEMPGNSPKNCQEQCQHEDDIFIGIPAAQTADGE
jgi:hypothetical protein